MAQIISTAETKKVADLIRIHIPDDKLESYTEQLNTVLSAVPVLNELNTDDVKITSQTNGLTNVFRADEPEASLDMSKYQNTQNFHNGAFIVDKVLQGS